MFTKTWLAIAFMEEKGWEWEIVNQENIAVEYFTNYAKSVYMLILG